ncbi:MAG: DUF2147 domain-containing protein [Pseudolabrys sp.]|jgi:uncharacterized protein (DUF2147 family)
MTTITLIGVGAALLLCGEAFAAEPIGKWYTAENRAQVRIVPCGHNNLCGDIVWLKESKDPQTGKPKTDINNPDSAKRNRPLIGVRIVLGLTPSNTPDKWQGQVYNADDGRTYNGYLTMTSANTLKLQGCVLGGIFCKSQDWTRAR